MMGRQQDHYSRVFYELSALVLNLLRSPPMPIPFPDDDHQSPAIMPDSSSSGRPAMKITPAGFASLLMGISLTMMLGGSVTFFVGFMLMPWVFGLLMVLYVVGIVSSLSMLWRSVICYATASPTPPKRVPAWKLL